MPTLTETLNHDFLSAFRALDAALASRFGGVDGYLCEADRLVNYRLTKNGAIERDLASLKACRLLYLRLLKTAEPKMTIASEDDIDFLGDFLARVHTALDPISCLKRQKTEGNNPDAEKYMPIEAEAREVSRRVVFWQKHRQKLALASAALLTLTLAIALKIRKGLIK